MKVVRNISIIGILTIIGGISLYFGLRMEENSMAKTTATSWVTNYLVADIEQHPKDWMLRVQKPWQFSLQEYLVYPGQNIYYIQNKNEDIILELREGFGGAGMVSILSPDTVKLEIDDATLVYKTFFKNILYPNAKHTTDSIVSAYQTQKKLEQQRREHACEKIKQQLNK